MLTIEPASERGHARHAWLDSHHTFSFAEYPAPAHMGFRALQVINEDRVKPAKGFGTHPHRDMEIPSYVLEGALQLRDSIGNASTSERVHFLQIWLVPEALGISPGYEQKTFTNEDKQGRLRVVASPDGRDGSVSIHTDTMVYAARFENSETAELALRPGRHAWVQVARGVIRLNRRHLAVGDGASLSDEREVHFAGVDAGEMLVFDLA